MIGVCSSLAELPERGVRFGCRLIVSARGDNPPYQPSIPAFVREAIRAGAAFLDGYPISREPWIIRSKDDVDRFYKLLTSPGRRSAICAFSLDEDEEDPQALDVSPSAVHRRTLGAAHVVVVTGQAAYMLIDLVGKEFSVFRRAVRTYRPQFDADTDDPLRHPLALPLRIANWQDNGVEGPEAFENFLVRNTIFQTVASRDLERDLPPFSEVRRIASTIRLDNAQETGASLEQLLRLYEEDNAKLQAALDEERATHSGLLEEAELERDAAQRRAEEARGEAYRLKQRTRQLEATLRTDTGRDSGTSIPKDLANLKGLGRLKRRRVAHHYKPGATRCKRVRLRRANFDLPDPSVAAGLLCTHATRGWRGKAPEIH